MAQRLPDHHESSVTNRAAEKKKLFSDMIDKVILGAVFLIFTYRSTNVALSIAIGVGMIAWGVIPYLVDRYGK